MKTRQSFQLSPIVVGVLFALGAGSALAAPQWVKGSSTVTNAIAGGAENGKTLSVCRAAQGGGTHPGKLVGGKCAIGYGGKEVALTDYELLTGLEKEVTWVAAKNGEAVKGTVAGGSEGSKTLAICRFKHENNVHPGKVVGTTCNIGYGGKEVTNTNYEVLADAGSATVTSTTTTTPTASPAAAGDKLIGGQKLQFGESIKSANGKYKLIFQSDGNFVIYDSANKSVWAANTSGPGVSSNFVEMHTDGRLILRSVAGTSWDKAPKWLTATDTDAGAYAQLTDDGRLVVFTKDGVERWASTENAKLVSASQLKAGESIHANQKLVSPNKKYELKAQADANLVIYENGKSIWSTGSGDSSAAGSGVRLSMQSDGNLVFYSASGGSSRSTWASNTNGKGGATASLNDDGTLTVKNSGGTVLFTSSPPSLQGGKLAADGVLESNQKLYSANKSYYLFMDLEGNLGIFDSAGKNLKSIGSGGNLARLTMKKNGTVSGPLSNPSSGFKDSTLILTDTGELVIREPGGYDVWSSDPDKAYKRLLSGQVIRYKWKLTSPSGKAQLRIVEEKDKYGKSQHLMSAELNGSRVWSEVLKSETEATLSIENNSLVFKGIIPGSGSSRSVEIIISSESDGLGGSYAEIDDEGTVLLKDSKGVIVWSSNVGKGILKKDRLLGKEFLAKSLSLQSKNGSYLLNVETGGTSRLRIMEKKGSDWAVKTTLYEGDGKPFGKPFGSRLSFGADGNLVFKDNTGKTIWATESAGTGYSSPYALITDDGKVKVQNGDGGEIWPVNDVAAKLLKTRLNADDVLKANGMIRSENGEYFAKMQTDGNFVVIKKSSGEAVWANNASSSGRGMYITMQKDGNLVQYDTTFKSAQWSTSTAGNDGAYAMVTNDGKLLIKSKADAQLWPVTMGSTLKSGDTLKESQSLKSDNGTYSLIFQTDRNLVLYDGQGKALWSNADGPGVPSKSVQMKTDGEFAKLDNWGGVNNSIAKGGAGAFLKVTNGGDVVVYAADGKTVKWSARGITK
jgi:hypothetical protein